MRSALALAWLLACDGSEPPLDGISLEAPAEIVFQEVTVGTVAIAPLPVRNPNPTAIEITGVSSAEGFTTDAWEFAVELAPQRIGPGETIIGRVTFFSRASLAEEVSSSFVIETNSRASTVAVRGRTLEPALRFEPARVDFGVVPLGGTSERTVTVSNLLLRPVVLSDGGFEHLGGLGRFELDANVTSEGTLLGGRALLFRETAEIRIRYQRSRDEGSPADRALLSLAACERAECEVSLPISASSEATALTCSSASIDLGAVRPGDRRMGAVECINRTEAAIDVDAVLTATRAFSLASPVAIGLEPGEGASFAVEFAPVDANVGTRAEGVLTLKSAQFLPVSIPIAAEASKASLVVALDGIDFGRTAVDTRNRRRIAIFNAGESELRVRPSAADPFVVEGSFEVGAGERLELIVAFEPAAGGHASEVLSLQSNDPDRPLLELELSGEGIDLPPCDHRYEPRVDFGTIELPRAHRMTLRIENAGSGDCLFKDFEASPPFQLVHAVDEQIVAPGGAVSVALEVRPEEGVASGALDFYASAPGDAPSVELTAEGKILGLVASPASVDFGAGGCASSVRTIDLFNGSGARVELARIDVVGDPSFALIEPDDLFLDPGARKTIEVSYAGTGGGLARLEVRSAVATLMIPLSASAGTMSEERVVVPRAADVLFVIDADAAVPHAAIGAAFSAFIGPARTAAIDWQAGVITTDSLGNGCPGPPSGLPETSSTSGACGFLANNGGGSNRWITEDSMPSPEAAFGLLSAVGLAGRDPPQAFAAAHAALSNPIASAWNCGFVRHDAALFLVFAAAIDDASPEEVDHWLSYFRSLELARNDVTVAAISGDACGEPSPRYAEIAAKSGGRVVSICSSDLEANLASLGELIASREVVVLDGRPDPTTIEVVIEDQPIDPMFYSFDELNRAIELSPLVRPGAGGEVLVRYLPLCL